MIDHEDFLALVRAEFERAARDGDEYTQPWLSLDVEAYRACRAGRGGLPAPFGCDPAQQLIMASVQGLEVLCLAGGGGQQSAVFGLLGANVTVFDLMPGQLEGDRQAAAHYGYPVITIQGDMHDLSSLPEANYDRVIQPISTLYAYDLGKVYSGVQRVLKPGGLYYVDFAFPLLYMAQDLGWNGSQYMLGIGSPYQRGEIREAPDGKLSFSEGAPIGEYHHLLSDVLNGLIANGLQIRGVWESPRPDLRDDELKLPDDKHLHRVRHLPFGLSVVAVRER